MLAFNLFISIRPNAKIFVPYARNASLCIVVQWIAELPNPNPIVQDGI